MPSLRLEAAPKTHFPLQSKDYSGNFSRQQPESPILLTTHLQAPFACRTTSGTQFKKVPGKQQCWFREISKSVQNKISIRAAAYQNRDNQITAAPSPLLGNVMARPPLTLSGSTVDRGYSAPFPSCL